MDSLTILLSMVYFFFVFGRYNPESMVRGWPGRGSVKEEGNGKSMNGPHKFGTEFGSDNAPEHSAAIVSHHDSIKWFEAIPGEQLCIRVHGTQVNGRYAIMENIADATRCTESAAAARFSAATTPERPPPVNVTPERFALLRSPRQTVPSISNCCA